MTVVYEDNHIIIVNKTASEIVQGDKTGDTPLSETVKQYLKEKYQKPGNVFIGVTHRLDRPVSGLVLLEVDLKTGRHHQIRCQLAKMGCPIKGDLKYGFARSNPDGSICLHARHISFVHPVSKEMIEVEAPVPPTNLWQGFKMI